MIITLSANDLRAMAANDLQVYADNDRMYLARAPHFADDRLVATMDDILARLGYTEPEFADEDEVVLVSPAKAARDLDAALDAYRVWRAAAQPSSAPAPMDKEALRMLNRAYRAALALEDPGADPGAARYSAISVVCDRLGLDVEPLDGDSYDAAARYVRDPLINQVGLAWHDAVSPDDTGFGPPHDRGAIPWIES